MSLLPALKLTAHCIKGIAVPRPSGQLSGHAGGLPFEAVVHDKLEHQFPRRAFRHYEALNQALSVDSAKEGWDIPPIDYTS